MIRSKYRRLAGGRGGSVLSRGWTTVPIDLEGDGVRRARRFEVPRIVITRGREAGRDEVVGTKCVIGRSPDADIVIEDLRVSRRHAYLTLRGEGYTIQDLGSCNGTTVNGRRVRGATPLVDGDVIALGCVELLFRCREIVGRS